MLKYLVKSPVNTVFKHDDSHNTNIIFNDEIVVIIMHLTTILKQIGLSEKEAKVYLTLFKLGESNLNNIAAGAGIPRTTVYTPLNSLIQRGFVDFYKKKGRKYYVATAPEKILEIQEENLQGLQENLERFNDIGKSAQKKPDIRFFEGTAGIKLIFNEILAESRPIDAITSIEDMNKIANEQFGYFIEKRIQQRLKIRLLTNKWKDAINLKKTDAESFRETKFVPKKYEFNTANYIYGNKVAMLSLKQEPIVGLIIVDKEIANTQKMYFELIWNNLAE